MINRDVAALVMEHVPDEIRTLRDSIATAETEYAGRYWENYREHSGRIKELKDRCEQAGHSLIIALEGKAGTRRRLFKNARHERRACIMCGTEEVGVVEAGLLSRFLLRRARWKFHRLNDHITRVFDNIDWYFETLSIIRHFSFSTEVVIHHAFPPQLPSSFWFVRPKS